MDSSFEIIEAQSLFQEDRPLHVKIMSSVRERGLFSTAVGSMLYVVRRGGSWWYDFSHGVNTRHKIPLSKLDLVGEAARHALFYEASDTRCLRKLLRSLNIEYQKFEFVDLGAGRGRSLLVAAEFPFQRILGAELSPSLCEAARHNCQTFRSKRQACRNFEVICGDAAEFSFPKVPLVVYLFNPFSGVILSRVLRGLQQSWDEQPRDVFVVYHNPVHSHVVENSPLFDLFLSGIDEWDYRKLPYKVFRAKPALRGRRGKGHGNPYALSNIQTRAVSELLSYEAPVSVDGLLGGRVGSL